MFIPPPALTSCAHECLAFISAGGADVDCVLDDFVLAGGGELARRGKLAGGLAGRGDSADTLAKADRLTSGTLRSRLRRAFRLGDLGGSDLSRRTESRGGRSN